MATDATSDIRAVFLTALNDILAYSPVGTKSRLAELLDVRRDQMSRKIGGDRPLSENERRAIAAFFGYNYESFLDIGRAILAGRRRPAGGWRTLGSDEMAGRGFLAVPFSEDLRLSAGRGGWHVPYSEGADSSPVVVHGPSLGIDDPRHVQAFRVGGDSMEPVIAQGGIVIADLRENDPGRLRDNMIYVLCWDLDASVCGIKRLSWAKRGVLLALASEAGDAYPPLYREPHEIRLVGRVVWAWREFRPKGERRRFP
jgi:hypothetical protein